jgi:hypothetical protein
MFKSQLLLQNRILHYNHSMNVWKNLRQLLHRYNLFDFYYFCIFNYVPFNLLSQLKNPSFLQSILIINSKSNQIYIMIKLAYLELLIILSKINNHSL